MRRRTGADDRPEALLPLVPPPSLCDYCRREVPRPRLTKHQATCPERLAFVLNPTTCPYREYWHLHGQTEFVITRVAGRPYGGAHGYHTTGYVEVAVASVPASTAQPFRHVTEALNRGTIFNSEAGVRYWVAKKLRARAHRALWLARQALEEPITNDTTALVATAARPHVLVTATDALVPAAATDGADSVHYTPHAAPQNAPPGGPVRAEELVP